MGIAAGNLGALGAHFVETTTGGSGAMTFDLVEGSSACCCRPSPAAHPCRR